MSLDATTWWSGLHGPRRCVRVLAAALFVFAVGATAGSFTANASVWAAAPNAREPQLTKPPELTAFVAAERPAIEGDDGKAVTVTLRLLIDAEGKVESAEVATSGGEAFDAAAVAAARRFVFSPAEVDGVPAPIRIEYAYTFAEVPPPQPPAVAGLEGTLVRRGAKTPLAGAQVTLKIDGEPEPRRATTDAQGRFSFEGVPAGTATVAIAGESVTPVQTTETLAEGERLEVRYEVSVVDPEEEPDEDADDLEIVVVAPPLRREVVATKIVAEQARKVPGTSGDVVRVVEDLPGVARSSAGTGQLVVWGASPQDTRVFVDGVPLPRLYHLGGLRSVLEPNLVQSIDLAPGGYGAAYGRGLGGLVTVTTETPERDRFGGTIAADVLDASVLLHGPVGKKKRVHVAGAVRASYLQPWVDAAFGSDATRLFSIPRYGDGQVRASWRPTTRDRLEVVGLAFSDRLERGVPASDPALATEQTQRIDAQRAYLRWTRDDGRGSVLTVTPFGGYARSGQADRFGATTTSIASESVLAGIRVRHSTRVRPWFSIDVGLDAQVDVVELQRVGSLGLPAREGDIRVFGQPPPDQIGADTWRVVQVGVAPWVEALFSVAKDRVRIRPGLRFDPYARSTDRRNEAQGDTPKVGRFDHDAELEPRLAVEVQPIERLTLKAAGGLYNQMPAPEDMSATFGNPGLPVSRALHTLVGAAVRVVGSLTVEATGFYTRSRALAMRSPDEAPLRARALEPIGSGRAYGMQVLLRQDLYKGLFGWVAYTFMRAERQNAPEAGWRPFDFDQTHVLAAVLSYDLPLGFETSGRFRFSSGYPRTPVEGAYLDSTTGAFQPSFGAHNSIRIPSFMQLDLRVAKRFDIRKTTLAVFLEVLNVWNRNNAEELVFSPDFSRRGTIRGFPVFPVLGVRWDF